MGKESFSHSVTLPAIKSHDDAETELVCLSCGESRLISGVISTLQTASSRRSSKTDYPTRICLSFLTRTNSQIRIFRTVISFLSRRTCSFCIEAICSGMDGYSKGRLWLWRKSGDTMSSTPRWRRKTEEGEILQMIGDEETSSS